GNRVTDLIGWVDARHLIFGEMALKNEEYGIFRKAMIINKAEELIIQPKDVAVKVSLSPDLRGDVRKGVNGKDLELQVCHVFFVFARTKGAVLIGKRAQFSAAIDR